MTASNIPVTVNCDMGEGFSLYTIGDDEKLMKTIHLANVACGFHASDFSIMDKTVQLAKSNGVKVGAHPSLPDRQGFGRREMSIDPEELAACFVYQIGALCGFLTRHNVLLNHIKPHGAVYGMTARDIILARAVVGVAKTFQVPFMGLAGTCHQQACEEMAVPFIAEWFADLEYDAGGKLLITKKHDSVPLETVRTRVKTVLEAKQVTTVGGLLPLHEGVTDLSICCHSDTPGAVEIAQLVKTLVDDHNGSIKTNGMSGH